EGPVLPEGTTKLLTEEGAAARYYDPQGNLLDEHGNVLQKAQDAPKGPDGNDVNPPAGSDVPHTPSPVKEPALVGAATPTVEHAGQSVQLGSSMGHDLGDVGRTPDNAAVNAGGESVPTVHAGGDGLPSAGHTGDHLPGGHAGDHLPGGSAHEHGAGPSASQEPPSSHGGDHGSGGHTHSSGGGTHEVPTGGHEGSAAGGGDGPNGSGTGGEGSAAGAGHAGGHPGGTQPPPAKEWQAADDIKGPARGKTLLYPNARHDLSGVRNGVPDDKNTVILPETKEKVRQDIADIAAGRAGFDPESQRYTVNGRRYAVEPSGRIFPVDGPGFVEMNRVEYTALKHIMKANGDLSKLQTMFSKAPQFRDNPQAVEKAIALYRTYYS
ncbi:hypothetical protein ABT173_45660, partial [Streptomyces sp. NPDC001795]